MQNSIDLASAKIIGKGSERICYQHPDDHNLCIKVRYRVKRSRDESEREYDYAKRLKNPNLAPYALPLEWVETSEGKGLVFPLIRDDDGQLSQSLSKVEDKSQLAALFDEFAQSVLDNRLSVTDLRLQNLVLQKVAGQQRIIMIDGYGFTNDFLKNVFRITSLVTHIQTKRRLDKFRRNYIND
ncbi:YrbL family protein [Vibrio atypicus]|uniref:YrbL family protein n=1 Tax=Vibrio atypicus TaxID=558271 RepID=UPI0013586C4A|nr:YrbL family protein [Vibrio atypicus]